MPDRLIRSRLPGARLPEGAVCVDRSTVFGNPWVVGDPGRFNWPHPTRAGWSVEMRLNFALDRESAVRFYRDWLRTDYVPMPPSLTRAGKEALALEMAARRAVILGRMAELRGRDMACYCPPGCPCHADVLMEIANA